jgi:predicted HTH domain antitoxin
MQDLVISADMLQQLQTSPSELRVDLAVYLYDKERMTMGQAKKLAGLTQIQFQQELAKRNVFIKYDVEDFEKDLRTSEELG